MKNFDYNANDYSSDRGPNFGGGLDISIGSKCNETLPNNPNDARPGEHSYILIGTPFCSFHANGCNISGSDCVRKGQYFFQVIDYEMYQVSFINS